ncbi:MAG: hypothetical protein QOJ16_1290 [Acidobacteriota bacterium]|nr:hypothetical protein [Acidobacteriota bacterium]
MHRTTALLMLAALLLAAPLALSATEPAAAPASGVVSAPAAPACSAASTLTLTPSPIFLSNTCGACSDSTCLGKDIGAACLGPTPSVCVSTVSCTANAPTCRCRPL